MNKEEAEALRNIINSKDKKIARLDLENENLRKALKKARAESSSRYRMAEHFKSRWLDVCVALRKARGRASELHNQLAIAVDINKYDGYERYLDKMDAEEASAQGCE